MTRDEALTHIVSREAAEFMRRLAILAVNGPDAIVNDRGEPRMEGRTVAGYVREGFINFLAAYDMLEDDGVVPPVTSIAYLDPVKERIADELRTLADMGRTMPPEPQGG